MIDYRNMSSEGLFSHLKRQMGVNQKEQLGGGAVRGIAATNRMINRLVSPTGGLSVKKFRG